MHVDVKHLPKLRDRDGSTRKRYLYFAIDRTSRYVRLAVMDDDTTASALAFLADAFDAFPFQITRVLADRGFCFTVDALEVACKRHGAQSRKTGSYTPKTNGMVERFNSRMQREMLSIMIYSHAVLDNYGSHKHSKVRAWLTYNLRRTFHFTPTSGSWLNAIGGFFSALTGRRLYRRAFTGVVDLQVAINRYIAEHNRTPRPFISTKPTSAIFGALSRAPNHPSELMQYSAPPFSVIDSRARQYKLSRRICEC